MKNYFLLSTFAFFGMVTVSNAQVDTTSVNKTETTIGETNRGLVERSTPVNNLVPSGFFWKLNGNAGTTPGINFIGTTDNVDLVFKRNNFFSGKIGFVNTSYGLTSGQGGFSNVNIGIRAGSNSNHNLNFYNISIGENAGASNVSGSVNTFVGTNSGTYNTTGFGNTFIGAEAGIRNTTGNSNTALGYRALFKNTKGDDNIALSNASLELNDTGDSNIALGKWAMRGNVSGSYNIGVGNSAGSASTGDSNVFIGEAAGTNLSAGDKNLYFGYYTGHFLKSGSNNIFIGARAGYSTSFGSNNLFLGNSSGVKSGTKNITIGENAGGDRGDGNILLGNNTNINSAFQPNPLNNNVLNIGNVVFGYNMNRVSSTDNSSVKPGQIGINTTTPKNTLEIKSDVHDTSGLRFTNLTSAYNPPIGTTNTKFLSVTADGDVVLENLPQTMVTNELTSSANTMTSTVSGIVVAAPIVNTISNTINNNQLVTTVNGVATTPVTLPVSPIQTLSQSENTITLSNGGGSFVLPTFIDTDTDAQTLSLQGNNLSISNGNSVVLPTYTDTDAQSLTLTGNTLSISNGNSVQLPPFVEVDGSVTNELQTLSQSGNVVTLSNNGGSFTLPTFTDTDTDAQSLSLVGNNLSISNGNTVVLPTYTDTDNQSLTLTGNTLSIANGNSIVLPSTTVTAGTNVSVTGNGSAATPYVVNSLDTSLYANNGSLNQATTINGNRVVDMNDRNIWFNTATSTTNGKMYIGSTAVYPNATGNYKLFVEGGILTEKVKVALRSSANWADYVFAEDYKLMPLSEVEQFIKENKHLPGVASATELSKNGLDIAEMQAKHMEKIEELTLYLIEKDKKIEAQNKVIEKHNQEIEELKLQVKALIEKTK